MIGAEWNDSVRSPASNGGTNSQNVHVQLDTDIDEHCEHARSAGATIAADPSDQFYGDRVYRAHDPEGHQWTFAMHVPRRQPGRGRGRHRPADHGARLGVTGPAGSGAQLDRTLVALADPRRRRAIELLPSRPHRAGELAGALDLTPSAMSRHLKVLRDVGLVTESNPESDARVRLYRLEPGPTDELVAWLQQSREGWAEQLAQFKEHVEADT